MDLSLLPSPFVLLLSTLIVIGVLKIIALLHHIFFHWKNKGLPYLPNSLSSLVITWKLFMRHITLTDYYQYVYDYLPDAKYIGILDFFGTHAVLLRDPELFKDIMVKNFEHFPDHRKTIDESIEPIFAKNIFFLRGDRWKEVRNTLSPCFTASKMKFMFDLLLKCSHDFVNYLVNHPELCHTIETKETFRRYTADVIATAAFGISVNSMKDRDNEFYRRGMETTTISVGLLTVIKFLFMSMCPRLAASIGLTFFPPATTKFFKRIVEETIKAREEQNIVRPDMIHLMQCRDKENDSVHKTTLDDIVSQAFIFIVAGFDSSSTLMCFIAHELAVNRDIQERLREEVQQHLAEGDGEISYESLSKMSYMDMVISEALRKYPPAFTLDRLCAKRYELPPSQPGRKSIIVEPGDTLLFPVHAIHRDPKYFPNPDKFDPERFSEENKNNILPYTYLPFGRGPRKCIGNRFALMETKILIAHLLQKFTLKTTDKTVEPIVYNKKEFNLQPVGGFWISLERKET